MAKTKSSARQRIISGAITVLIIIGIAVAIILLQSTGSSTPPVPSPQMTLDPQIAVNLTQMPHSAPLTGDAAAQINQLKAMVEDCPDYVAERRSQMEQHIAWLLNPATIPEEMIIALGANPSGKLIYGMATYTSIQWKLLDQPGDSCLIPIAAMLNDMLIAAGEPPFGDTPSSQ